MKLKYVAAAITALVIVTGFAMISPLFFRSNEAESRQRVMLSFSISESEDVIDWSRNLASVLNANKIGASVFVVGRVAEKHPQIVSYFGERVDIGSQTYNYLKLTDITDYSVKLQEIKEGKVAVDSSGNLETRVFRAPFGATDADIYSLLSRSGILADFSYQNQYNVYRDGQFLKYSAITYEARDYSPTFFATLPQTTEPIIINLDNSYPPSDVEVIVSALKKAGVELVNASELTGLSLTTRRDGIVVR